MNPNNPSDNQVPNVPPAQPEVNSFSQPTEQEPVVPSETPVETETVSQPQTIDPVVEVPTNEVPQPQDVEPQQASPVAADDTIVAPQLDVAAATENTADTTQQVTPVEPSHKSNKLTVIAIAIVVAVVLVGAGIWAALTLF